MSARQCFALCIDCWEMHYSAAAIQPRSDRPTHIDTLPTSINPEQETQ